MIDITGRAGWEKGPMPRGSLTIDEARRLEASDQAVNVEMPPEGSPPLIITSDRRLSPAAFENIRQATREAMRGGRPVIFDAGLKVFQLIDGRWQPLKADQ